MYNFIPVITHGIAELLVEYAAYVMLESYSFFVNCKEMSSWQVPVPLVRCALRSKYCIVYIFILPPKSLARILLSSLVIEASNFCSFLATIVYYTILAAGGILLSCEMKGYTS